MSWPVFTPRGFGAAPTGRVPLWLAALVLLLAPAPSPAATLAYEIDAPVIGNQAFEGVLAMDFEVLDAIEITALGVFDSGGDGIAARLTVELWERVGSTGQGILARTTLQGDGTLVGSHRIKPIALLSLVPGQYSIVAYGFNTVDLNGNADGFGAFPGDFP